VSWRAHRDLPPPKVLCAQAVSANRAKAIAEHQRQTETIRGMQNHINHQQHDIEMLKRELHALRVDNDRMQRPPPQGGSDPYADQYGRPRPELPPLRSLQSSAGPAPPDTMTGVQYDQPRANGYRTSEPGRF
jgi:hypothetical protein